MTPFLWIAGYFYFFIALGFLREHKPDSWRWEGNVAQVIRAISWPMSIGMIIANKVDSL